MKSRPAVPYVPLTAAQCAERAQGPAPGLRRRLAAFLYESMLLFGVVFVTDLIFAPLMNQRHALWHRSGLMATLFLTMALYFMWFWTHGGQTLAMKTWHVRLVARHGGTVSLQRALARYLGSWLWIMPPILLAWLAGWQNKQLIHEGAAAFFGWIAFYALLSWLHPQRQFLHDALCGTRLIDTRP